MSEQGRKQEDISAHKSSRTTTAVPPQLGSSPSLLTYPLPPHEYAPHHQLYTMMRPGTISMAPQPIQPAKPCMTNEMGPPIFMPSLNLGTPKSSSVSAASSPLASSPAASSPATSSGTSTSSAGSPSTSGAAVLAHPVSDMILSNAPSVAGFHSLHPFYPGGPGIRPGSGQPQYMSIPTAAASAVASSKHPSVSVATIAKPTPVQAGHGSKLGSFVKSHPVHQPLTSKGAPSNAAVLLVSSSSGHGLLPATVSTPQVVNFPPGSSVIKQPTTSQVRQVQAHHHHHHHHHASHTSQQQQLQQKGGTVALHQASPQQTQAFAAGKQQKVYINAPIPTDGSPESIPPMFFTHQVIPVPYQAMIQTHGIQTGASGQPQPHPVSSTLTELLAPGTAVVTSSLREGGGKTGKIQEVGVRPYSPGQQHHSTSSRHGPTAPVRERSSSGDAGSGSAPPPTASDPNHSHATSAQPTPTAANTDTRLERPAQPSSSANMQSSQQLPSPQNMASSHQGPHRERSNSSEVSNIIISVPGLTGRHIAAISGNQSPGFSNGSQPQPTPPQQPSDPYRGSRVKSEYSGGPVMDSNQSASATHPSTLNMAPQSGSQVVNPNAGSTGVKAHSSSVSTYGQIASTPSTLTATVISSSSSVNSPGAPHPNSLPLSVSASTLATMSPSRMPSIIRKRPHESSWKVESSNSPNTNKPFGSPVPLSSPGHAPRAEPGPHSSHPLSPPPSSTHHSEPLTNHVAGGRVDLSTGETFPSPRKKRRKQDVIATDDQYATNVPNNIRPDVAMTTMDSDHLPSSPPHQSSAVTMVTRAQGQMGDPSNQREDKVIPTPPTATPSLETEKAEVQYLSQLRQSQWPINGLYRMHQRAAHNHFKRHADIKHIEPEKVTAAGIANSKTAAVRASGWKIYRLDPQIEEMLQVERNILEMMQKVDESISNLSQCASCTTSADVLSGFREIVQGNVARSSRIMSHLETARTKMVKLLEHKPAVMDLLHKYSSPKHPSPVNCLPHKLRS